MWFVFLAWIGLERAVDGSGEWAFLEGPYFMLILVLIGQKVKLIQFRVGLL